MNPFLIEPVYKRPKRKPAAKKKPAVKRKAPARKPAARRRGGPKVVYIEDYASPYDPAGLWAPSAKAILGPKVSGKGPPLELGGGPAAGGGTGSPQVEQPAAGGGTGYRAIVSNMASTALGGVSRFGGGVVSYLGGGAGTSRDPPGPSAPPLQVQTSGGGRGSGKDKGKGKATTARESPKAGDQGEETLDEFLSSVPGGEVLKQYPEMMENPEFMDAFEELMSDIENRRSELTKYQAAHKMEALVEQFKPRTPKSSGGKGKEAAAPGTKTQRDASKLLRPNAGMPPPDGTTYEERQARWDFGDGPVGNKDTGKKKAASPKQLQPAMDMGALLEAERMAREAASGAAAATVPPPVQTKSRPQMAAHAIDTLEAQLGKQVTPKSKELLDAALNAQYVKNLEAKGMGKPYEELTSDAMLQAVAELPEKDIKVYLRGITNQKGFNKDNKTSVKKRFDGDKPPQRFAEVIQSATARMEAGQRRVRKRVTRPRR